MTQKHKSTNAPTKKTPEIGYTVDARSTAVHILREIVGAQPVLEHAYADSRAFGALDARDQSFVRQLVLTTLRHLGQADALIKRHLERPLPSKYDEVRWILRIGCVQLMWMRVPDYAAVSSSVELAKLCEPAIHAGLVNAVLSQIARNADNLRFSLDDRFILPLWLWRRWSATYGEDKARQMAHSLTKEPLLDITLRTNHAQPLAAYAETLDADVLPQGTLRLRTTGIDVPRLAGYEDGDWWVQNASASLPARLFGAVEHKTLLDMCAAPGGKTMQLATAGAKVTALDAAFSRLTRLNENIARMQLADVEVVCADALQWKPAHAYDGILLDAPCSATGTLRRHPEGLWQKKESDVSRLAQLQRDLIVRALEWLTPEGILVYATCSLEPEEGEQHIEALLNERSDIALAPITQREAVALGIPKSWVHKRGWLRILPHFWSEHGGVDGFFIARLRKL